MFCSNCGCKSENATCAACGESVAVPGNQLREIYSLAGRTRSVRFMLIALLVLLGGLITLLFNLDTLPSTRVETEIGEVEVLNQGKQFRFLLDKTTVFTSTWDVPVEASIQGHYNIKDNKILLVYWVRNINPKEKQFFWRLEFAKLDKSGEFVELDNVESKKRQVKVSEEDGALVFRTPVLDDEKTGYNKGVFENGSLGFYRDWKYKSKEKEIELANRKNDSTKPKSYLETLYGNLKNMPSGGVCDAFRANVDAIYYGGIPDNVKILQLENIADKAIKYGCLR